MATTLDQILTDLGTLRDEVTEVGKNPNLTFGVASLVSRVVDHLDHARDFTERAIALDDAAYPEDFSDPSALTAR